MDLKVHLVPVFNDFLIDLDGLKVVFACEVLICHLLSRIVSLLSNGFPNFGERGKVLDVVSWMGLNFGGHLTAITTHCTEIAEYNFMKERTLSELNNVESLRSVITIFAFHFNKMGILALICAIQRRMISFYQLHVCWSD